MFINVQTLAYSDFFVEKILTKEDDLYEFFKKKQDNNKPLGKGMYAYANPQFGFLNPLFSHVVEGPSYGRIDLNNVKSKLKRIKRLKNTHYEKITFIEDGEDYDAYMKRRNKAHKTLSLCSYGSADSVEQVMKLFKFLDKIEDRYFFVSFELIEKSNEPERGGFRQCKNGPYIGNKTMMCEYFVDEGPEFENIVLYHIYEVKLKCDKEVIETTNFKFYIGENSERHTHMTVFDKVKNELIAYVWRIDKNEPNILGVGYGDPSFTIDLTTTGFEEIDAKLMEMMNETI